MTVSCALRGLSAALRFGCAWQTVTFVVAFAGWGVMEAATCDTTPNNMNTYIALAAGSCSISNGGTISNIRYSATTTGSAPIPSTSLMGVVGVGTSSLEGVGVIVNLQPPVDASSSVTINFAYTITAPSGLNLTQNNFNNSLDFQSGPVTATESLCVGGTFTGFPPSACTGTLINRPGITSPPAGQSSNLNIGPAKSVDVLVTLFFNPFTAYDQSFQDFVLNASSLPPPATPVPPSLLLTLTGVAGAGLYETRRRWLARFKTTRALR
jgi:hypothetical protein